MRCPKRFGKDQGCIMLGRRHDVQVFQRLKFVVYGHDELLQTLDGHLKTDATDSVTVLERKQYSLLILQRHLATYVNVIENERQER